MSEWKNHGRRIWPYRWVVEQVPQKRFNDALLEASVSKPRPTSVAHRSGPGIFTLDIAFALIDGTKSRAGQLDPVEPLISQSWFAAFTLVITFP